MAEVPDAPNQPKIIGDAVVISMGPVIDDNGEMRWSTIIRDRSDGTFYQILGDVERVDHA